MNYYMISIYENKETKKNYYRPFINPYDSIKRAKEAVKWQDKGGFSNKNIICKRINKDTFEVIKTKEVVKIDIKDRTPYTLEAWNDFLKRSY